MSKSSHETPHGAMNSRTPDRAMNRRSFLGRSTAAAATAAAVSTGVSLKFSVDAFAAELTALSPEQGKQLLAVARAMFPHPTLSDDFYAPLVTAMDEAAAGAADVKTTLVDGLAKLDELAGGRWADLPADQQFAALEDPALSDMTGALYGKALTAIYNNPNVWTQLGYEGSSAEHGGYINRGFNDLNWLDAPSEEASPKVA